MNQNQILNRFKKISNQKYFPEIIAVFICFLFSLAGILINLNRFWQYELGYYDFGIFDRAIWNVSQFKLPVIDHFVVSNKIIFADHFNPSIFLFSPLYWLNQRSEILLIAINIIVGLSGYALFLIGSKLLKNKYYSLVIIIIYFLFTGLQNAVYSEFHEVTAMTLFLMLTYWAIFNKKTKLFYIFLILTLGFKESLFLLGIGLAIYIFLYQKDWCRHALSTFLIAISWGYFAIKIIKLFSGGAFLYDSSIPINPIVFMTDLFFPIIKLKTIILSMLSFSFLPLLGYQVWPIILLHYGHRFLTPVSTRWDLGLHYNAEIAPTLAIAAILGLVMLQKKLSKKIFNVIIIATIGISVILYQFILHGPIALAYNPIFYQHTKDFYFLDRMVKKVPAGKSVSAQNNLTLPFLHQKEIWILTDDYKKHQSEYILLDVRDGQNPSNYLGINDPNKLLQKIKTDNNYSVFYHQGDQYVFKRRLK